MQGLIGKGSRDERRAWMEPLEQRRLLTAHVTSVAADNRGLVVLGFDTDLDAATLNSSSVTIFTAGADQRLGTPDDVAQAAVVNYTAPLRALTVGASLPADTRYRLRLNAGVIRAGDGSLLDGEFNGATLPSGNEVAGGNYEIITSARTDLARFSTLAGNIDVELFAERTPQTVGNFATYANSGAWDGTFLHRSVPNFVVQGGGFEVNSGNQIEPITALAPVVNEPGVSNLRGTIAMAKAGGDPNSATDQWFFNLGDNSQNLDNQNGGFTAFGQVTNAAGLAVVDAIAALPRVNAGQPFDTLPVRDLAAVQQRGGQLDPQADLVFVNRVAMLMSVRGTGSDAVPVRVVSSGSGAGPVLRALDANGEVRFSTFVHGAGFGGGVRVAQGDINGDGINDYITGTGNGASHVRVIDGQTGQTLAGPLGSFLAFPGVGGDPSDPTSDYYRLSFKNGVYVAAGDMTGDGKAELIVSADAGGTPHVKIFNGADGTLLYSFFAFDQAFAGGVRVAAGDVTGDGRADLIVGAGSATPHVKIFDGRTQELIASFFAYDPGFQNGIFVAAGDVNGDGRADVITGTGVGPAHVKAFDIIHFNAPPLLQSFFAYDPGFLGGVRVGAVDVNGDGTDEILTGTGVGADHVKAFQGSTVIESFLSAPNYSGGVYVA